MTTFPSIVNRCVLTLSLIPHSRFEEIKDDKPESHKRPRESDAVEEGDEKQLSKAEKKRLKKKLKAEGGQAVAAEIENKANGEKEKKKDKGDGKGEKKDTVKATDKKDASVPKEKELTGGIKAKDIEIGTGPQAKKGNTVSMRYIGKLQNGKVFDKNNKGPPVGDFLATSRSAEDSVQ